ALQTIREAVDIRRRLVRENPARFEPVLATSLNSLSNLLDEVGDNPGALQTIREAVDVFRRLSERNPQKYQAAVNLSVQTLQRLQAIDSNIPEG
ncbi:MAG: tetratricopeptide repeat protein, partial [Sulfuricaulis sp.]